MAVERPKLPLRALILNVEPLNSDQHLSESAGSSTAAQRIFGVRPGAAHPVPEGRSYGDGQAPSPPSSTPAHRRRGGIRRTACLAARVCILGAAGKKSKPKGVKAWFS